MYSNGGNVSACRRLALHEDGAGRLHDRKGAVPDERSLCEVWNGAGVAVELLSAVRNIDVHEANAPRVHLPMPSKGAFSGMYIGLIAAPDPDHLRA